MTAPSDAAPPQDIRARLESAFAAWAYVAIRHRWRVVLASVAFALLFASFLPTLTVNNSTDAFLHPGDPIRVQYDGFREQYGRDTRITLAIESDAIFSLAFLEKLRALHEAVEAEVPYIDDVDSLINARDTRGEGDTLVVGDLLEDWPETEADLARLKARVEANPLYRNTLISADGNLTTLSITLEAFKSEAGFDALEGFDDAPEIDTTLATPSGSVYLTEVEQSEAVQAARAVKERFEGPEFRMWMAGSPVLIDVLNSIMVSDIVRSMGSCLAIIAVFLAVLFRHPSAVVLPLLIVVLSLMTTLGVVAMSGTAIGFGTQLLPSFLIAVGVCDSVHILAIYYLARRRGRAKDDAISDALGHSAVAILMTSLTTAGGLASFTTAELAPIAHVGIFAPLGVMFAFAYTAFLMPALMAILPMGATKPAPEEEAGAMSRLDRVLSAVGIWSVQHRAAVLAGTAAVVAFSGLGASFLYMSHDPMEWLPDEDRFRQSTALMNERLEGVNAVEVVFRYDDENAIKHPEVLDVLEGFEAYADRYTRGIVHVGQTISVLDVLRETHQALNANDAAYYEIPSEPRLIAQELLLFESSGTDDLEDVVDTTFSQARMSLRVPWVNTLHYPAVLDELRQEVLQKAGPGVDVDLTGMVAMLARTFDSVFLSMVRSYVLALVIIVPLMMLLLGSFRLGLISMVPNLTPILMLLGFLGWREIPIDGMSLMAGAIVLGLAIDDTIHYMHNFRRRYVATGDSVGAIDDTLQTTGRALLFTTLVLAAGFTVFVTAYMSNVAQFGLLTAGTIVIAFVSNIVVGSALMSYASEWGIAAGRKRGADVD